MNRIDELKERLIKRENIDNQIICCIEEMSEATKVLTKYLRKSRKFSKENLTEEIAHSLLMLQTVQAIFSIEQEDIEKHQLDALERCFSK